MDYALLAATALGAIGLYLMLPRERAPLARLGALLGTMGIAGFFLYLLRIMAQAGPLTAGGPPVYFYMFAAIMIASAVGVVCQARPVYAALYFVLLTLAGAGLFVLLLAQFMAIVLIIIYAGAILVTYVFVIMLASQGSVGGSAVAAAYDRRSAEPFLAVLVSFLLIGAVLQALLPTNGRLIATPAHPDPMMIATLGIDAQGNTTLPFVPAANAQLPTTPRSAAAEDGPSDVQLLGMTLYSKYALSLELAGILLTVSLVGAVVIARKGTPQTHALGTGKLPTE